MVSEDRLKGLRFLKIGIILFIVLNVLNILLLLIMGNMNPADFGEISDFMCLISLLSLIHLPVSIAVLVLFGRGAFLLKEDGERTGGKFKKDTRWAFIGFWIYLTGFVISFLWGFLSGLGQADFEEAIIRNSLHTFISVTFNWATLAAIIFIFVLSIRAITNKRQQNFLFLYAGFATLMTLLYYIGGIVGRISGVAFILMIFTNMFFFIILDVVEIGLLIGVYYAYQETIALNKGEKIPQPKRKAPFSRDLPMFKGYNQLLNRPLRLLGVFVIFGMIVGGILAVNNYYFYQDFFGNSDGEGNSNIATGPEITVETISQSDRLTEGDTAEIEMEFSGRMIYDITITLTWRDEGDMTWYQNSPDIFTLQGDVDTAEGEHWSSDETGANARNDEGRLSIQFPADESSPYGGSFVQIMITLDEAGDYYPRLGPGLFIRSDTYNDYNLVVEVEYLEISE
ncbi:MAG: hypothetical protein ACMUHB_05030 [Thermoplasmatota archaeon]